MPRVSSPAPIGAALRGLNLRLPRYAALAVDTGEPEWSAYSGALGSKFLRLDQFLKTSTLSPAERK